MLYTFIINIIIIIIGIVGAIIVAITSLRGLIEDIIIIKRGNRMYQWKIPWQGILFDRTMDSGRGST